MTRDLSVDSRLAPSTEVLSRRLGVGAVLVHLSTNRVFELNETGARIWELLAELQSIDAIVQAVRREFEVEDEEARLQVTETVDRLRAQDLLK